MPPERGGSLPGRIRAARAGSRPLLQALRVEIESARMGRGPAIDAPVRCSYPRRAARRSIVRAQMDGAVRALIEDEWSSCSPADWAIPYGLCRFGCGEVRP